MLRFVVLLVVLSGALAINENLRQAIRDYKPTDAAKRFPSSGATYRAVVGALDPTGNYPQFFWNAVDFTFGSVEQVVGLVNVTKKDGIFFNATGANGHILFVSFTSALDIYPTRINSTNQGVNVGPAPYLLAVMNSNTLGGNPLVDTSSTFQGITVSVTTFVFSNGTKYIVQNALPSTSIFSMEGGIDAFPAYGLNITEVILTWDFNELPPPAPTSTSGTSASGTSASGTSASGTSASGTAASGTTASGTSASGTASGTAASGTASGTVAASSIVTSRASTTNAASLSGSGATTTSGASHWKIPSFLALFFFLFSLT